MADDLVVIGQGRLIEQCPVEQFVDRHAEHWVRVRSPQPAALAEPLARRRATVAASTPTTHRRRRRRPSAEVGELAAAQRRRAARAVAADRVAGGRVPAGHRLGAEEYQSEPAVTDRCGGMDQAPHDPDEPRCWSSWRGVHR